MTPKKEKKNTQVCENQVGSKGQVTYWKNTTNDYSTSLNPKN